MILTTQRTATFSSSNIWKLMTRGKGGGFGAPALKYIKQIGYELRLGKSLSNDTTSRPTSWGTLVEKKAFDLLPLNYQLESRTRLFHQSIEYWSGMPDIISENLVGDIKCPYTLEAFCDKLEALKDIEVYKKEFPEDYWQHISNAVLLESNGHPITDFEAIIFCPYFSELDEIKAMASDSDDLKQYKYFWIANAHYDELPHLIDGGYYQNLNVFKFEIPQADKDLLEETIFEAGKHLITI